MSNNPSDSLLHASRFWQYSYQRYSQPALAEQLLAWQQTHGINVNLLLFSAYCQHHQLPQDSALWLQLAKQVESVNTGQFRQQRRRWQNIDLAPLAKQQLKQHLLAAELLLERREQQLIIDTYRHHYQLRANAFDQQVDNFWCNYGFSPEQFTSWLADIA